MSYKTSQIEGMNTHTLLQMIEVYYRVNAFDIEDEDAILIGKTSAQYTPDATIKFFKEWVSMHDKLLKNKVRFSLSYSRFMDNRFVSYTEFEQTHKHLRERITDESFHYSALNDFFMIDDYESKRTLFSNIENNFEGYLKLLNKSKHVVLNSFLNYELSMYLSLDSLQRHCHILGKTGTGKSNLIKLLIYRLLNIHRHKSIVLIEPHGDLSEEVRDLTEQLKIPERLVYLDPFYGESEIFVFNPFMLTDTSLENVDIYSQELTRTLVELLKDGVALSGQMEAVLRPCVSTLLFMENTTLEDLQQLMDVHSIEKDRSRIDHLLQAGKNNPFVTHRNMFIKIWCSDKIPSNYKTTMNSIYTKIQSLFNTDIFYQITCGNNGVSTINLEKYLDDGKMIICNLSKGRLGSEASETLGKLFVSTIQSIAFKRAKKRSGQRTPSFIFIDEFQNYITESITTILSEARKYGMHLILAHQSIGQLNDTLIRDTLLGNSAVKIIGESSKKTLKTMAEEIDLDLLEFKALRPFEFYVSAQNFQKDHKATSYRIKPDSMLIDLRSDYYQNGEEKNAMKRFQLQKYYVSKAKINLSHINKRPKPETHQEAESKEDIPKFDF